MALLVQLFDELLVIDLLFQSLFIDTDLSILVIEYSRLSLLFQSASAFDRSLLLQICRQIQLEHVA